MPADLLAGTVNLMAGGAGLPAVQAVLFLVLLFAVSVWDIKHREIPDSLQAAVAMTAFLDFSPADLAGLLTALPYLLAALAAPETEGIGGGDIKLAAAAGIVLGLPAGLAASAIGLSGFIVYVGIYVGGGRMLHCGSPIQYTSIETPYWQAHLYAFGRLPN